MYKCDFCGKDQTKVKRIIVAEKGVCICNECVFICTEVLLNEIRKFKEIKFNDEIKKEDE